MYIDYQSIPLGSKCWVFISNTILNIEQTTALNSKLVSFIDQWTAHSKSLNASFKIIENMALIIAVDESLSPATGCSIDKLNHFLLELKTSLKIDFFDRMRIIFKDVNNQLHNLSLSEFKSQSTNLDDNTSIMNIMQTTKVEDFFVPTTQTWVSQHIIH